MDTAEIFDFLLREIHTAVIATADGDGNPVTCAVDIMDSDGSALYFLTARGKDLYRRLKQRGYAALTGIRGESTMTSVAVSVQGKVKECGRGVLFRLLEKNRYMYDIYPTERSREGLAAFALCEGRGEWFDLSKRPIERIDFTFGAAQHAGGGYVITEGCNGCGACLAVCPQGCISLSAANAKIEQSHCLRCGDCLEACPRGAVRRS